MKHLAYLTSKLISNLLPFLYPKKNWSFWLIFRYPSSYIQEDLPEYKSLISKITKSGVNLKLMTDTETA